MYVVYKHVTPNKKIYIGITSQKPIYRWDNGNGYKDNAHFFKAIKKYGWENIEHFILYDKLTKGEAEAKEIEMIALLDTTNPKKGYNLRKGGATCSFSKETIEKMRLSHIGKKASDETKAKMRKSRKGKTATYGMLGHKHSEKTKELMSEKAKQRFMRCASALVGEKNPRAAKVCNIETGEIFANIKDACEKYGVSHSAISNACRGVSKTSAGYHWQYVKGA